MASKDPGALWVAGVFLWRRGAVKPRAGTELLLHAPFSLSEVEGQGNPTLHATWHAPGLHFDLAQCERVGDERLRGRRRKRPASLNSFLPCKGRGTSEAGGGVSPVARTGHLFGRDTPPTGLRPATSPCRGGRYSGSPRVTSTPSVALREPPFAMSEVEVHGKAPDHWSLRPRSSQPARRYHAATSSTSPAAAPSSLFSSVFSRPPLVIRSPVRSVR